MTKSPQHLSKDVRVIVAIALLLAIAFSSFLYVSFERINHINASWKQQEQRETEKSLALAELHRHMGYNGLIHNFKNYVLRKNERYKEKAEINVDLSLKAIRKILNTQPTQLEIDALKVVREVIEDYQDRLGDAALAIESGLTPAEIDRLVQVDDTLSAAAMNQLSESVRQQTLQHVASIGRTINDTKKDHQRHQEFADRRPVRIAGHLYRGIRHDPLRSAHQ